MAIAKVVELIAQGNSIEDAVNQAIEIASKTVRNIKSVYVKDIQAKVDNNKVVHYRLDVKISFVLDK